MMYLPSEQPVVSFAPPIGLFHVCSFFAGRTWQPGAKSGPRRVFPDAEREDREHTGTCRFRRFRRRGASERETAEQGKEQNMSNIPTASTAKTRHIPHAPKPPNPRSVPKAPAQWASTHPNSSPFGASQEQASRRAHGAASLLLPLLLLLLRLGVSVLFLCAV